MEDQSQGQDRRSFLRNAGMGGSVLAMGPLLASIQADAASAAPMAGGKFDFDTPYNRIGTNSVHWDMAIRDEHMTKIIAGMGVADMDFKCAPAIMAGLRKRMEHENWGYNLMEIDLAFNTGRTNPFIDGIIEWNRKRYGITNVTPKNLGVNTGVHSGIIAAMQAYAPPGSGVLMATPIYGGFYGDVARTKTVAVESPMKMVNGRFEIDWEDFERRMTPNVKVSILCNPQNPVGRAWTKEELTKYVSLCLKHNIVVLSDEIHCDFVSKGHKYVPVATLDDKKLVDNTITFKSVSKSFSLAGMKCAWYFSTNPEIFARTQANVHADLNTLGVVAAQSAYAGGAEWMDACVDYIDGNHDFANQYIKANIPLIKTGAKPEGTYLTWLDISGVADKMGAQKMADQINKNPPANPMTGKPQKQQNEDIVSHYLAKNAFVYLQPGTGFGLGGHNHLRMNIATSRRTLKAALDSVAGALKNLA